jgi:outer membrane immunogenic protein
MKKYLLGGAAAFAWAGAACAADMPTKALPVKAPPVVTYDWTGFYIGAFYGASLQQTKAHTDPQGVTGGSRPGQIDFTSGGLMLGGTLGYNWQFSPSWLLGVEGEFGTLGIDRTFKDWDDPIIAGSKADWYGTVRGRFGYVTGPSLLYVTAGASFVNVTDTFGGGSVIGPALPATTNTTTKTGYTVGGGIETKLSRNWSTTTEYQYVNAGSTSFNSDPLAFVGTPTTFDHSYHLIKTGLNYKLDGNWEGLPFFGAPMLPSNHDWSGFYAGLNVGGGISNVRAVDVGTTPGGENQPRGTGGAAGGQVGYNYMLTKKWFVGVEGDVGYLGVHAQVTDWNDNGVATFEADTNWYATARARFGTSTGPALLYFTAGGAWVGLKDGFAFAAAPFATGDIASRTASGWTVGGGTEVALDSRWSARIESLYIDAGHREHVQCPTCTTGFADFKDRFMVVRAGLSYQFGGGVDNLVTTKY